MVVHERACGNSEIPVDESAFNFLIVVVDRDKGKGYTAIVSFVFFSC